jgi:NAD(P)-dependent dehydrogenase (short-subunit alcohol dehydrogenase family)
VKADGIAAVTGASQGIGLATALALANRGMDVLALVLDKSMADGVHEAARGVAGSVEVAVLDVTDPGDFDFPRELSVLVNNAGIRRATLPVEMSGLEEWRAVFEVNFFGLVEVTRRAIPMLRANGRGVICNVSSTAMTRPGVFTAPYRSAKAAVSAYSESLRMELTQFGIRIVEILPGATATGINKDSPSRTMSTAASFPDYRRMAELLFEHNKLTIPPPTPSGVVGEVIADAIFDDDGPMRYATDENSRAALALWRSASDEDIMRQRLAIFASLEPG